MKNAMARAWCDHVALGAWIRYSYMPKLDTKPDRVIGPDHPLYALRLAVADKSTQKTG